MRAALAALVPLFFAPASLSCGGTDGNHPSAPASARAFAGGDAAWTLLQRTLPGSWTMQTKSGPFGVSYTIISGGSALVEHWGAGTQHETQTVFYRDHSELLLTHYCAQGNQPRLRAVAGTADSVDFSFVDATNEAPGQSLLVERRLRLGADAFDDTEIYRTPEGRPDETTYHFTRVGP